MSKLDKARQAMKELYFASKSVDSVIRSNSYSGLMGAAYLASSNAAMLTECANIPWGVFSSSKPAIDKRRARRYHRKYIKKLESEGSLPVKLLEIDNTLTNGNGYYKQLAEQLELKNKLEIAISLDTEVK